MPTASAPRPLLAPALGLVAGIALAGSLGGDPRPFWLIGVSALLLAPWLGARASGGAVVLGFVALGLARGAAPQGVPLPPDGDPSLLWQVEVRRSAGSQGQPVPVWLRAARAAPEAPAKWTGRAPAELRLAAWPTGTGSGRRGELWLVRGKLRPARRAGPPTLFVAGPRRATRLVGTDRVDHRLGSTLDRGLDRLRHRVRRAVDRSAPQAQRGLLLALALGDRRDVDPALREAFARTGTAHLLAISGLHVGCLAGVLLLALRFALRRLPLPLDMLQAGLPDRLAWLAAVAGAAAYVLLAGMPVSGRRALVMLACAAAGAVMRRRTGGWNGLAGAALLVAWFEPDAVCSAGYQLSVASVAGLLALAPGTSGPTSAGRALRWLVRAIGSSAAATLATAPLCAGLFGRIPVAGLWVNVAAIPLLGLATVPPLLVGAALGAVSPALGAPALRLAALSADLGCRLVLWCAAPDRCPVIAWEPDPLVVPGSYLVAALVLAARGGGPSEEQ